MQSSGSGRRRQDRREPRGTAYDAAVRILGARDHSRFELNQKLSQRGFEEGDIDGALDLLVDHGYIDDERFARLVLRQYSDRGSRGVAMQMQRKGIPAEIYRPLLEEISYEDERMRALEALEKRVREIPERGTERERWKARMGGYLGRRGFSGSTARSVIEEVLGRNDDY